MPCLSALPLPSTVRESPARCLCFLELPSLFWHVEMPSSDDLAYHFIQLSLSETICVDKAYLLIVLLLSYAVLPLPVANQS